MSALMRFSVTVADQSSGVVLLPEVLRSSFCGAGDILSISIARYHIQTEYEKELNRKTKTDTQLKSLLQQHDWVVKVAGPF